MGRKITILGMGPSANRKADNIVEYVEDTECWGLNNGYLTFPALRGKWSRIFELHNYTYLKTWDCGRGDHFVNLQKLGCPVYVGEPLPLIENQVRYDFAGVMRHFKCNYFLGSPSLMLMLALYEHDNGEEVEELRSWGIDTSDPQHGQQRSSWAWWLGKADERGIRLTGSSTAFMAEFENDDGLRGLREHIGKSLEKEINEEG